MKQAGKLIGVAAMGAILVTACGQMYVWSGDVTGNVHTYKYSIPIRVDWIAIERIGVMVPPYKEDGYSIETKEPEKKQEAVLYSSEKRKYTSFSLDLEKLSAPGFVMSESESNIRRLNPKYFYLIHTSDANRPDNYIYYKDGTWLNISDEFAREYPASRSTFIFERP